MNQPSIIIEGEVRDPQGRPAAQARVALISGPVPLQDIAMLTGADGKFILSVPGAGVYKISVSTDNCAPLTATVAATAGQNITLQLELQPVRE